ncbi:thioredoxin family protein [Alicyclobacillus herbarius]|uniref:thioredoxin family protein n=1 Tax=Alicyclobacillus herbarius TaxID=122960 RepID=UPI002355FE5E|nr:thioredoxin family protein [Alicyclobacillus herbarius]
MIRDVDEATLNFLLGSAGEGVVLFLHTPLCGTCQLARKMVNIACEALPNKPTVYGCNLNLIPHLAQAWQVTSVPCLLFWSHGKPEDRVYAFHSVMWVVENLHRWLLGSELTFSTTEK